MTGQPLQTFERHSSQVKSVAFSADGGRVVSGSADGTIRIQTDEGLNLVSLATTLKGEWLVMTPAGFFDRGGDSGGLLHVVRGFEVTTIDQVHQSLFNPDLVREALAGDPNGEVKLAAGVISLDKVIDSGPAPFVEITSHASGSKSDNDLVTVVVRASDRGKGIGRSNGALTASLSA